jgi:hypothetical protein
VSKSGDDLLLPEGAELLRDASADDLRKLAEHRRRLASRSEVFGSGYRMTGAENVGRWFVDQGHAPTADELSLSCSQVGRNGAAELLFFLDWNHLLTDEALRVNIADVWSSCDGPELRSDQDLWRDYFERAGYTVDGKRAEPPAGPVTLYRGAPPKQRADWAWTDNRESAAKAASGEWPSRLVGKVWRATVDPWRLLAGITYPDEHEYVVDTDELDIVED